MTMSNSAKFWGVMLAITVYFGGEQGLIGSLAGLGGYATGVLLFAVIGAFLDKYGHA